MIMCFFRSTSQASKKMEPIISTNAENIELQQVDDQFVNIMQEFNEFRENMTQLNSNVPVNFEDLIDLYISHGSDYSNVSQSTRDKFTALLQDFTQFESTMLPPYQVESTNIHNRNDLNKTNIETQESEMMIREMAGAVSLEVTGSSCSFPSVNATSHIDSNWVNVIRYSSLTCYEAVSGTGGCVLGPFKKYFRAHSGSRMIFLQREGVNLTAGTSTPGRKRIKRKYRGVIETEEETACRLERTKIKNREAAAKAQADKRAHEASLWTELLRLRKKNEFRKKLVMFLEGHERVDMPPKSIRRAISGPM